MWLQNLKPNTKDQDKFGVNLTVGSALQYDLLFEQPFLRGKHLFELLCLLGFGSS